MGQSKDSYNLLYIKEINLWDWYLTNFFFKSEFAQLDIYGHIIFMIILETSTSIVISVHSLSLLKMLILHDSEKDYICLDWCLITWQN